MTAESWNETLQDLLINYEEGLYIPQEVISSSIDLFNQDNSEQLWALLPTWVKDKIIVLLTDFDENSEVICFGRSDPEEVKKKNMMVKEWLEYSNFI